jgi:imidazolonepropionase
MLSRKSANIAIEISNTPYIFPMDLLIKNIRGLAGAESKPLLKRSGSEMQELPVIGNAYLIIRNGLVKAFGSMNELAGIMEEHEGIRAIDAEGKYVIPAFVDSHTHIVFAASREEEFVMRIKGMSYEEIARQGGGILNSAKRLQQMGEDELFVSALDRLHSMVAMGTGAIEIKSGYGLTLKDELKMLRVISRLKSVSPVPIKATFLGAHAVPLAYREKRQDYISLIINEMLPQVAEEKLADYCDVFCDRGFFTVAETEEILNAASAYGLKAKIHGNELGLTGGVQVAVKCGALSVDHLEHCGDEEIACLLNSSTMPVALPGTSFFLGIPYSPARKMIDAGLPLALASDFNPGSSPSGNMNFVMSLACTQMKMLPEEALNAVTLNAAYALEMSDSHGSIAVGKAGSVIITRKIPSLAYMSYSFGTGHIDTVVINGRIIN